MTFLSPEFTHPHGAELGEVSLCALTVRSRMQSGYICGIPNYEVVWLASWTQLGLVCYISHCAGGSTTFPKATPCPAQFFLAPAPQLGFRESPTVWKKIVPPWLLFRFPASVRSPYPMSSKDWLYAQTRLDHKTLISFLYSDRVEFLTFLTNALHYSSQTIGLYKELKYKNSQSTWNALATVQCPSTETCVCISTQELRVN